MNPAEAVLQRHQSAMDAVLRVQSFAAESDVWDQLLAFEAPLTTLAPTELAQAATNFCEALGKSALLQGSVCSLAKRHRIEHCCTRRTSLKD